MNPQRFLSLIRHALLIISCAYLQACIEYNLSGTLDKNGIDLDCRDTVDNDHDGWVDSADPDCVTRFAITELGYGASVCNDGLDNDGDGAVDADDNQCVNAMSATEGGFVSNVFITEFMANPKNISDANGEWIELYNASIEAIDIKHWILQDSVGSHVIAQSVIIPAQSYIVLSRASNASNGLPMDYTSSYVYGSGISLSNSGDSITLLNDKAELIAEVTFSTADILEGCSTQMSAEVNLLTQSPNLVWCFSSVNMNGLVSDKASPAQANQNCL
jgi:hypothetical protein